MKTKKEIKDVVEKASDAFWSVVANSFPEITTGDFPPMETIEWDETTERMVQIWINSNAIK